MAGFTAAESSESDESSNRDDDFRDWLERARERAEEAGEAKEAAEQVGDAVDEALDIGAGDKTLGDAARERAEGAVDELKDAAKDEAVEAINDEIADVADIPADARPTTDGIAEGLAECDALGPACVEEILDELEEGFEESLERTLGRLGEDEDTGGGDGDGGTGSDGSGGGGSGRSSSGDGDDGSGAVGSGRGGDGPDGPDGDDAGGSGNGGDGPDGGGADGGRGSGGGTGERGGDDDGDDDSASTYGEPHLRTFDGVGYDLHVPGEFVGARAEGLEVQIRYEAIPCGCPVTVVGAAAISDGETSVSVNRSDGRLVAIDGERIDLDEQESVEAGAVRVERTRRGVEIVDRDGNVVSVYVIPHHLDVVVTPVDDRPWEGLLGNHNGDPDDEFSTSEGEDLGASPAADVISGTFAESWRITQEESRFEYEPGESTETFANAPFPLFAPDDEIRDLLADQVRRGPQAEAVCRLAGITDPDLAADCAMDFQVTGNVSFVHSVQAVERGTQGPRASSTSSAGPVRVPDAQLKEISGADLATGAGLVLVRVEHPDGRLFLSAVDVETREPRWRVTDIDPECRPAVVADVGVVAQVQGGTERLGDDRSAIVLLSLDDGSELARFVGDGDDVLTPCDAALNASGDVVVHLANQQARGFRVDREEIALLWRHDFAGPVGGHSPAVDGHFVVASFIREQGAGVALDALDVETGESSSTIAVDGRFPRSSPAAIAPVGDARLAVSTDGPDGDERDLPALTLIDGSGGSLREVWSVTYGPDDDAEVIQVVRVGDQLVGWTDRGRGRRLAGLSLDGGERVWSHVPESSDDPPGLVVGLGAETAVIGAHPDALLELVDGDDQDSRLVDLPDGFAAPQQITVIDRDTVVVSGATDDGGVYVDFVDL